jgi:heterodisulfide reductase subunit C
VPVQQHSRDEEPAKGGIILMANAPAEKKNEIVKVNFDFRRELAQKIEGNLANYCYQCGACVGDCPATTYSDEFNPREIMLKVLYGLEDELIKEDSVLWLCTNCYNCAERCPQEVKPVEVIISLKNMLADMNIYPDAAERIIKTFEETGRTTPISPAIEKRRAKFGLPQLHTVPMDEINALLAEDKAEPEAAETQSQDEGDKQ